MGQGRSKEHLDRNARSFAWATVILLPIVILVALYYALAHLGLVPSPPPIDLIG
jgi:hypothetical protein